MSLGNDRYLRTAVDPIDPIALPFDKNQLNIRVTSDFARDLTPWPLLRRDGVFGRKVVVRPQHEGDAAAVDEFGGQPLDHALRGVRLHLAAPQALGAPPLDFLLRRAGRKHFGEAAQRLLEPDRLIEAIAQRRVVGRGRERPELDRSRDC